MKTSCKGTIFLLSIVIVLILSPGTLSALPVRNITTAGLDTYLNGDIGFFFEDVFILTFSPGFDLLAKAKWQHMPHTDEVTITGGSVFDLWKYTYAEVSYALKISKENTQSIKTHGINLDFYYERSKGLIIGGLQFQFSEEQLTLMPSLAGKYFFTDFFSLWGKYIFIYDTITGVDNAFWGEGEFSITPAFSLKTGGTLSSYSPAYKEGKSLEWSILAGLSYAFSDQVILKYLGEYTSREEFQLITNSLILDLRFK